MNEQMEKLVEEIAALEHDQWIEWSKTVAPEVSEERRERWQKYWIPYEELSEDVKEYDRIWARKVIAATLKAVEDGMPLPGEKARITSEVEGPFINALKGHTYIVLALGEGK